MTQEQFARHVDRCVTEDSTLEDDLLGRDVFVVKVEQIQNSKYMQIVSTPGVIEKVLPCVGSLEPSIEVMYNFPPLILGLFTHTDILNGRVVFLSQTPHTYTANH